MHTVRLAHDSEPCPHSPIGGAALPHPEQGVVDGLRQLADLLDTHPKLTLLDLEGPDTAADRAAGAGNGVCLYSYEHEADFLDGLSVCDLVAVDASSAHVERVAA